MEETNSSLPKISKSAPKSPRACRANIQRKISKLSKEQLALAVKKKNECNKRAIQIVEEYIDPSEEIDDDTVQLFRKKLKDINQFHYQDIVEERAITKLCGYPLCINQLKDVPKKQFQISVKSNKVYDITERKNFCSSSCYRKSNYLKEQLLNSPLWLREHEEIPEFKLLSLDEK